MSNNKVHYAFPHEDGQFEGDNDAGSHGMTLRDYFAAKAMQAMIASDKENTWQYGFVANEAYLYADAMLAERDK